MNKNYTIELEIAIRQNLADMAGIDSIGGDPAEYTGGLFSQGITVIVGVTGKRHGRIILDTSLSTAQKLAETINEETEIEQQLMIDTMAELTNIISGHTITMVNNRQQDMQLMLTPPSVFYGSNFKIVSPKISAELVNYNTPFGPITVSIGFEGGR